MSHTAHATLMETPVIDLGAYRARREQARRSTAPPTQASEIAQTPQVPSVMWVWVPMWHWT